MALNCTKIWAVSMTLSGCGIADDGATGDFDTGSTAAASTQPADTSSGDPGAEGSSSATGSGAGSGTAAADTTDDGGPIVGMDCDLLGVGAVDVWEDVSPPEFVSPDNMETTAVVVNPIDCSVYATAGNKTNGGDGSTGVLKSTDGGASWTKISTGENGAKLETGLLWSMRIDPEEPERMYLANGYGNDPTIYRSLDGGVNWTMLQADPEESLGNDFAQAIGMDPADPKHIIITWHDNCVAPHTPLCLAETHDGGDVWNVVEGPTELPGWAEGASISIMGPDSFLLAADSGGWFTADHGASWTRVIDGVHYGSYGGGVHFGPDGAAYLGMATQGTYVSYAEEGSPLGATWSLVPNSPQAAVLIDDGVRLFATYLHNTGGQPFFATPLDDIEAWTNMASPSIPRGSNMLAYDPTNHLLYGANLGGGLWRLRTQ